MPSQTNVFLCIILYNSEVLELFINHAEFDDDLKSFILFWTTSPYTRKHNSTSKTKFHIMKHENDILVIKIKLINYSKYCALFHLVFTLF